MVKKTLSWAVLVLIPFLSLEGVSWGVLTLFYGGFAMVEAERKALVPAVETAPRAIRAGLSGQTAFVLHPYFGFVHDPTGSQVINSHGFVGPDLISSKDPLSYNVVITGGSVAGNVYNFSWRRLREGLRAIPALAGKTVNLYNLAVAGYKQPQQLMTLAWFLSQGAKIDLLINIDGFNEMVMSLQKNAAEGVCLDYPILWKDLTSGFDSPERRKSLGRLTLYQSIRASMAGLFGTPPLDRLSLFALLWRLADELPRDGERRAVAALERGQADMPYFMTGPIEPPDPRGKSAALDALAANWAASSKLMSVMVQERGGAYLHVLQPNQYVEGSKPFSPEERRLAFSSNPQTVAAAREGYARLFEESPRLRASGVLFFDASQVFAKVEKPLYFDACCHFNEEGADILCDAIVEFIQRTLFSGPGGLARTGGAAADLPQKGEAFLAKKE